MQHSMSTAHFDELIHAPTRLEIVSLLAAAEWADFKYIRDELGLSDSALSKQLSTLESAGYVEIRRRFVGKRPRTSASLSAAGRQAFEQHVAALQQIIARSRQITLGFVRKPGGLTDCPDAAYLICHFNPGSINSKPARAAALHAWVQKAGPRPLGVNAVDCAAFCGTINSICVGRPSEPRK
jgi:DNA-binding MarR family transcriptional regulator